MKRLFIVRDRNGKALEGFYDSKMTAKRTRDKDVGEYISYGPDHRKFNPAVHGEQLNETMNVKTQEN